MNKLIHLFKLGWEYKIARSTHLSYPPYQYTIEPTNVCNLRCPFCPQSDSEHASRRAFGQLTEENLRVFLDHLKTVHPGNRNINFTLDGEPFLNKHFNRFVEMAAADGLFVVFAANGTLLDRETADRLIAAGPFRASTDFAGSREVFESIRGREGDFDTVLGNLRYLADQSRTYPGVHLDIHDITPYTGADPEPALQKMRGLFPADLPDRVRFDSRVFHNFCGHLDTKETGDTYRLCPYPWTQMAVAYNGDCVACCRDTVGRSVVGNVFRDDIMTVWNSAEYQQLRRNLLDRRPDLNAACKNCDLPWSGATSRWRLGYILRSLLRR